jgi:mannosyl-oligosaccharide alpha-1,2-mannosidase
MDLFAKGQNETLIPGLWPMFVSMRRMDVVTGNTFTIAGCADSLYEYLPKMAALLEPSPEQNRYAAMSRSFLDAADAALLYRPMLPGGEDLLMAGTASVNAAGAPVVLDPETEHLSCFIGGAYALAGKLFRRPRDVELGAKLARGCVYSYRAMPTGMGPERWNMVPCPSRTECKWDEERWLAGKAERPEWKEGLPKGFTTAKDPRYILRPEAIESVFVLYRVTGRYEYQQAAWEMFKAVANGTATDIANAAVMDVTARGYPLLQEDYMEVSLNCSRRWH